MPMMNDFEINKFKIGKYVVDYCVVKKSTSEWIQEIVWLNSLQIKAKDLALAPTLLSIL